MCELLLPHSGVSFSKTTESDALRALGELCVIILELWSFSISIGVLASLPSVLWWLAFLTCWASVYCSLMHVVTDRAVGYTIFTQLVESNTTIAENVCKATQIALALRLMTSSKAELVRCLEHICQCTLFPTDKRNSTLHYTDRHSWTRRPPRADQQLQLGQKMVSCLFRYLHSI